jgi:site-specific DNA recombinase
LKKGFEMYATGTVTFDAVREFFGENGIRTRNGKLLVRRHISQIFGNPIYYGHFRHAGEVHEGKHEAIISKKLSDDVQIVIRKRLRWTPNKSQKVPKVFMGLLRCGECGGGITAEIQKGHTYYRCTKKNRLQRCSQPFIREEALDVEISNLLQPFALNPDWAEAMLERVKEDKKASARSDGLVIAARRSEIDQINARLQGSSTPSWTRL